MAIQKLQALRNFINSSLLLVALRILIWSEFIPSALAGVLWEGWGLYGG